MPQSVFYNDECWYESRIVGQDPLNHFMKFLSNDVQFSCDNYTNHLIRATCITTLDKAGFEARHIIKLSSHKNESSIKDYATECPEDKRKEMFTSLSKAITPKTPSAVLVEKSPKQDLVTLPEDMQLESLDDWNTIDDEVLSKLIYDMTVQVQSDVQIENQDPKTAPATSTVTAENVQKQVKTQFNTINNTTKGPLLPHMYFPNSNITINYNFNK